EYKTESSDDYIEILKKESGFQTASKDLDSLLESQRLDKNKEGLGYSIVPSTPAQIYSSPKKDMSWTGLPEFKDDTVTDYSRPAPTVESSPDDAQNINLAVTETEASPSTISPKSFIKFVKANDSPTKSKTDKAETAKKPPVKYAKQYRKPTKKPNVRGYQRNWNNLKSYQLGPNFVMKKNACFNCGDFNYLAYDFIKRVKKGTSRLQNTTHKSFTPRPAVYKPYRPPMRPMRSNMNGKKGKAVKPSACWFWKPSHNLSNKGPNSNSVSVMFKKYTYIDTQGRLNGCSRHMTGNISYLSDYEPFDGGYVSFGQGGCKIIGKGTIKTGKLEFKNMYFVKDLKTPRQHNMYSIDLNNIVPHKDLTCLVAKASADECMLWHRRLGHLNFKTMNKLVRHNLVRGLPTKCFENDHTCTACLKGKQHKASWTSFLKTKDKASGILRKFIIEIENLKDLKVKIIRCDNGEEFRNKEMNYFCSQKGIKREFSNARTPQQNGVAKIRNVTLIEAARIMLADAKLPTPYELLNGKTHAIGFLKPFGCHVMILNTLDNLGKFEAKGDEGYFIGYSMSSKAFRVFNKRTRRVEENLNVEFLENKAIEKGAGPNWLFDINSLTKSMNYVPVDAGTNSTNLSGTKDAARQEVKKDVSSLRYIALPNWVHNALLKSYSSKPQDDCSTDVPESSGNSNPTATLTNSPTDQLETLTVETPIPTVSSPVPTACFSNSPEPSNILEVTTNSVDSDGVEADVSNIEITITASPTPTLKIHKDHPKSQIIGHVDTPIQTKNKSNEVLKNKKDERGIVIRNKARLVVQGHTQKEGIDYDEVFAPIVRIEAIKLFLAYALFIGFTIYQMDVKSAFLYGTIDEEVYVMQPPGFQDPEFPAKVYKVEKAMYGLHQAPRAWYDTLSKYLLTNGF
nr:hypothetical protein [Tanacetum cinerariifolium]